MKRYRRFGICLIVLYSLLWSFNVLAQEDLTQTFNSSDSYLSFRYPAGWNAGGMGDLAYISSTEDAFALSFAILAGDQTALKTSQISIRIFAAPLQSVGFDLKTLLDENTALQVAQSLAMVAISGIETQILKPPTQIQLGEHKAVAFSNTMGAFEQLQVIIFFDRENLISLTATTLSGELQDYEAVIMTIAQSLNYVTTKRNGFITSDNTSAIEGTNGVIWQLEQPSEFFKKDGFGYPDDVEIAADDTIFVLDQMLDTIKVINPDGEVKGTIVNNLLSPGVQDIALAPDGTIWATDTYNRAIHHFDSQGNILSSIDVGRPGDGIGQFAANSPDSIVVASDGDLYVFDGQGESRGAGRIEVFDSNGEYQREFLLSPYDRRRFSSNVLLAMDAQDNLYTSDFTDEIRVFDKTGRLLKQLRVDDGRHRQLNIYALAVSKEGQLAVTIAEDFVYLLDTEGQIIETVTTAAENTSNQDPFEMGEFGEMRGIGFLSNGDIVVSAYSLDQVKIVRFRFDNEA